MLFDPGSLVGEGVALRPWRRDDAGALVAAWADPEIRAGSIPPADRSLAAAERWIEGCPHRAERGLALDLVMVDARGNLAASNLAASNRTASNVVVGEVGISAIDQRRRAALVGWWVAAPARGQRFATAGVDLFVSWLLTDGPLDAVIAEIGVDNYQSIRVAQGAGLHRARESDGTAPHVFIRRRTRPVVG